MMNTQVMNYLFADVWQTGLKLMGSARLKAETEHRPPAEVMDVFLDLVAGVKRFEILCQVRDRISLLRAFDDDKALEDKESRGVRIYEFGDSAQVLNNALNATVLFLDLRGFTQTSEGQISERDLTRELYTVFDAFVPHIRRFGGTVDKFLGDGIMVTYGTQHADPLTPLNALRTAILCQETLQQHAPAGQELLQDGHRHTLRTCVPGALHRRRGDGADHGDRPLGQPGRAAWSRRPRRRWTRTRTRPACGAVAPSSR